MKLKTQLIEIGFATAKTQFREKNQDFFMTGTNQQGLLIGVMCDGMGGYLGGEIAAKMFTTKLIHLFSEQQFNFDQKDIFQQELEKLVDSACQVLNTYRQHPELSDMGTTMVACVITPNNEAFILNVGDSRCYYLSSKSFSQITQDQNIQNYVQAMNKTGTTTLTGMNWTHRNVLYSAIGPKKNYILNFFRVGISHNCMFILTSDGLHNMLNEQDFKTLAIRPLTAHQRANDLVKISLNRKTKDNTTALILDISYSN